MFEKFDEGNAPDFEPLIDRLLDEMKTYGPNEPEYEKHLGYLERVDNLRTKRMRDPINTNTVIQVAGSLVSVLAIVAYEQRAVLSKSALTVIRFLK